VRFKVIPSFIAEKARNVTSIAQCLFNGREDPGNLIEVRGGKDLQRLREEKAVPVVCIGARGP
jgi:hypothetical protein